MNMILRCSFISIILTPMLVESSSILRNDPRLPRHGTKNWRLLDGLGGFSPRHSHATCVFKCPDDPSESCIWLTGGYSDSHRTFDVEIMENENSDVWWSKDGATWNQVTELYGDFLQGVGNGDAKVGGYVAPWYSRYGHSLNALDSDGDGVADTLVMAGGFNPLPSNDIWITKDGITWYFDGYAPWPKRSYHGATVFQDQLWIMGGSPLSNDVWSGHLEMDASRKAGYRLTWEQKLPPNEAPWTPRAGFCAVSQLRQNPMTEQLSENATVSYSEQMFIIGGLALSEDDPDLLDGTRARNDVWKTPDGQSWERVLPPSGDTMPWRSRSFHSCVTWHGLEDKSRWIGADSSKVQPAEDEKLANSTLPRIFITGGGYMGKRGNNEVRELEAHTDTWWSYDGADWARINYEEGSKHKDNLYSTNEWTETTIDGRKVYRGKWGHTLEAFHVSGEESVEDTSPSKIPSLFVIGGKLESSPMVNDVFVSERGVHCELDGITCGGNVHHCGPGTQGCRQ